MPAFFLSCLRDFNKEFGELFGETVDEGEESTGSVLPVNDCDSRFAWPIKAKQVADFEGKTLDECFKKDTRSFLNYLIYLKAYGSHQEKLMKNANR